jgi:photosystem II stability/assembly factor-like uncharacterized protein
MLTFGILLLMVTAPVSAGWGPLGGPIEPRVELRLDPSRPELLYARVVVSEGVEEAYLWRSEDGGTTWRDMQSGLLRPSSALAIDPANPRVIWVWTSDSQLWRSGDAGETWSRRFATPANELVPTVFQLLVDPGDPETLYRVEYDSGNGTRVAVSRDGGRSFQNGAFVRHFYSPEAISFNPGRGELVSFDDQGLEVSLDGGRTWTVRGSFNGQGFAGGRLAPSAPDTMYALLPVAGTCLVRSEDAGAHWTATAFPTLPPADFQPSCYDVAIDPRDARHVWVAVNTHVEKRHLVLFESRDGGASWSEPLSPPTTGVAAAGGDVVYTGSVTSGFQARGQYVSTDGGRTWRSIGQGIAAGDMRPGLVAQGISGGAPGEGPSGGIGRRLVGMEQNAEFGSSALFRSDGGRTWVKLSPRSPRGIVDAGGTSLLAVADRGVFRSGNGGETWRLLASTPPQARGLESDLLRPQYVSVRAFEDVGDFGRLAFWTSDDGGVSWRRSSTRLPINCSHIASSDVCPTFLGYTVDPFDTKRRWVVEAATFYSLPQLFVSIDAGASWKSAAAKSPSILELAADPRLKDRLLAGTTSGLRVSRDGGQRWHPLGDLPQGAVIRQFAYDARLAAWYAATYQHGIYRSLDGGAHWTLLAGAPDFDAPTIAVDPQRPALLAAFRGQGVWRWTP